MKKVQLVKNLPSYTQDQSFSGRGGRDVLLAEVGQLLAQVTGGQPGDWGYGDWGGGYYGDPYMMGYGYPFSCCFPRPFPRFCCYCGMPYVYGGYSGSSGYYGG